MTPPVSVETIGTLETISPGKIPSNIPTVLPEQTLESVSSGMTKKQSHSRTPPVRVETSENLKTIGYSKTISPGEIPTKYSHK